jgi:hypothetical protein
VDDVDVEVGDVVGGGDWEEKGCDVFSKKKKKAIGIFTDSTVELFNRYVADIAGRIEEHLNRMSEVELTRAGLLDFGDFFEIQYDKDADGEVYPDVYDEIERGAEEKKKGKGGKPSFGGKMPIK